MADTPHDPSPQLGGEPANAACEAVPQHLVELHEVLDWEAACRARAAEASD